MSNAAENNKALFLTQRLAEAITQDEPSASTVAHLLKEGADATGGAKIEGQSYTMLELCGRRSNYRNSAALKSITRLLIMAGADYAHDYTRLSAMRDQIAAGYFDSFDKLFSKNPDLLQEDKENIVLIAAAASRDLKYLERIVSFQVDVNKPDRNGQTPIYTAIQEKNLRAVQILIEAGAVLNIVNHSGLSPEDFSRSGVLKSPDEIMAIKTFDYVREQASRQMPLSADRYVLTGSEEISCIAEKRLLNLSITEIFNFAKGTYTQVVKDLETKSHTSTVKTLSEMDDAAAVDLAAEEYRKQTGQLPHNGKILLSKPRFLKGGQG